MKVLASRDALGPIKLYEFIDVSTFNGHEKWIYVSASPRGMPEYRQFIPLEHCTFPDATPLELFILGLTI